MVSLVPDVAARFEQVGVNLSSNFVLAGFSYL
jgi:hypothetical protein